MGSIDVRINAAACRISRYYETMNLHSIRISTYQPSLSYCLPKRPSPNNPPDAKSADEGGIIPVAGVIANAVAAALDSFGVQPRELPLSPPRVWQLIRERMNS